MTWLLGIGIFYAGMLVGILVSALCVAASDTRARHHAGRTMTGFTVRLSRTNPITGKVEAFDERHFPYPHANA